MGFSPLQGHFLWFVLSIVHTHTLPFVFLAKSAVNLPHHEALLEAVLHLRIFSVPYKMLTAETLIESEFSRAIHRRCFTHASSYSASSMAQ